MSEVSIFIRRKAEQLASKPIREGRKAIQFPNIVLDGICQDNIAHQDGYKKREGERVICMLKRAISLNSSNYLLQLQCVLPTCLTLLTPSLTISKVTCKQVKRDPNILSSHYSKLKWFSSGAFGEWGPFKTQSLYLSLIRNKIVATLLDKVTLLSCPLPQHGLDQFLS